MKWLCLEVISLLFLFLFLTSYLSSIQKLITVYRLIIIFEIILTSEMERSENHRIGLLYSHWSVLANVTPVLAYLTYLFEIDRLKCELFYNCIYNTKHERLNCSTLRNSRRVKEMHLSVLLPQPGKLLYKSSNFEGPFHLLFGFFVVFWATSL